MFAQGRKEGSFEKKKGDPGRRGDSDLGEGEAGTQSKATGNVNGNYSKAPKPSSRY